LCWSPVLLQNGQSHCAVVVVEEPLSLTVLLLLPLDRLKLLPSTRTLMVGRLPWGRHRRLESVTSTRRNGENRLP
jgi:hypothetical protein